MRSNYDYSRDYVLTANFVMMMLVPLLLYCTVLYCTVLYCTVLYCTVLYVQHIKQPNVAANLLRAAGNTVTLDVERWGRGDNLNS